MGVLIILLIILLGLLVWCAGSVGLGWLIGQIVRLRDQGGPR